MEYSYWNICYLSYIFVHIIWIWHDIKDILDPISLLCGKLLDPYVHSILDGCKHLNQMMRPLCMEIYILSHLIMQVLLSTFYDWLLKYK